MGPGQPCQETLEWVNGAPQLDSWAQLRLYRFALVGSLSGQWFYVRESIRYAIER